MPEYSSTYSGPNEKEYDQLSIDADHLDIIKFNNSPNQDLINIRQRIIEFVDEAPVVIEKRIAALTSTQGVWSVR